MIEKVEIFAANMLFIFIVLSIFSQVVSRYGFGLPIVWVEEAATYAFIWIVFLGAAIGMKRLSHIRIEALSLALPDNARAILRLFGDAVMLFVTLYLCYRLPAVMNIEARSGTVSLPVELPRMYFYSVPLFVSCVSITLTLGYYFVADVISLRTGQPMRYIDGTAIDGAAREGI